MSTWVGKLAYLLNRHGNIRDTWLCRSFFYGQLCVHQGCRYGAYGRRIKYTCGRSLTPNNINTDAKEAFFVPKHQSASSIHFIDGRENKYVTGCLNCDASQALSWRFSKRWMISTSTIGFENLGQFACGAMLRPAPWNRQSPLR